MAASALIGFVIAGDGSEGVVVIGHAVLPPVSQREFPYAASSSARIRIWTPLNTTWPISGTNRFSVR